MKKKGANVNETDSDGRTPLMHASSFNFLAVVELLVKKGGAGVNLGDNIGFTALAYAAQYNNTAVVTWLVDKGGAELDQPNSNGTPPPLH